MRRGIERRQINWRRVVLLTLCGLLAVFMAAELKAALDIRGWWADYAGSDYESLMKAVERWVTGGGMGGMLYPPTAIWFMLPFAYLPAALWWILPAAAIAYLVASWRPAMWSWPMLLGCLAWPKAFTLIVTGNPSMWIAVFVGLGLRFGWPGALVLLKPSVFPFALVGIRSRGWWITAGTLAILTLPLASMIPDWLHAVLDWRGSGGLLYSVPDVPLICLPVVAWAARSRRLGSSPVHRPQGHSPVETPAVGAGRKTAP